MSHIWYTAYAILSSENESEENKMSLTKEQGMMVECLKLAGASDATIGAVMILLPTNRKIAMLAKEMLTNPGLDEDELLMLAIRVGHAA